MEKSPLAKSNHLIDDETSERTFKIWDNNDDGFIEPVEVCSKISLLRMCKCSGLSTGNISATRFLSKPFSILKSNILEGTVATLSVLMVHRTIIDFRHAVRA